MKHTRGGDREKARMQRQEDCEFEAGVDYAANTRPACYVMCCSYAVRTKSNGEKGQTQITRALPLCNAEGQKTDTIEGTGIAKTEFEPKFTGLDGTPFTQRLNTWLIQWGPQGWFVA